MLAKTTYPQHYIDGRRDGIAAQLAGYDAVAAALPKRARPQADAFDRALFANLILVLDQCFVHRTRAIEGKDGNPCNEVRMLCASILEHDGVLAPDKTIRYRADESVLGLEIGDEIALDRDGFARLAAAYFAEIERRFT